MRDFTVKQWGRGILDTQAAPAETRQRLDRGLTEHLRRRWPAVVNRNSPAIERFFAKVEKTETCWNWLGSRCVEGYGRFRDGRAWLAHRWAYTHLVGTIPDGLTLDHLCRNTSCVNPAHLEPVTMRVNVLRGESPEAQNARKTHCKRGHEFTKENILWVGPDRNGRLCRTCKRDYERAHRAERNAARRRRRGAGRA